MVLAVRQTSFFNNKNCRKRANNEWGRGIKEVVQPAAHPKKSIDGFPKLVHGKSGVGGQKQRKVGRENRKQGYDAANSFNFNFFFKIVTS